MRQYQSDFVDWVSANQKKSIMALILAMSLSLFSGMTLGAAFNAGDYSPLNQIYGLPLNQEAITQERTSQLQVTGQLISISTGSSRGTESVLLDGEIYRLDIYASHQVPGWTDRWLTRVNLFNTAIAINIPVIRHGGGFMDSLIEDWHELFGFPNGNRDTRPRDELLYQYVRDGETIINFSDNVTGVGDVQLSLMTQSFKSKDGNNSVQFRAGIKLPTGEEEDLTGSGKPDAFFDVSARLPQLDSVPRLRAQALVGYLRTLQSGPLKDRLNPEHFYGSVYAGYEITGNWTIASQVNFREALYVSPLRQLGKHSLVGTFGLHWAIGESDTLDFFFTEDLSVSTTQDVSFGISWKRSFGAKQQPH